MKKKLTNREVYEEAAGMNLCKMFFTFNNIDPDAPWIEENRRETIQDNKLRYLYKMQD